MAEADFTGYHGPVMGDSGAYWRLMEVGEAHALNGSSGCTGVSYGLGTIAPDGTLIGLPARFRSTYILYGVLGIAAGLQGLLRKHRLAVLILGKNMFEIGDDRFTHMPFVGVDGEFKPYTFCCIQVDGKWKIHHRVDGEWERVPTGLPADATECGPVAEFDEGMWKLSFIAGGHEGDRPTVSASIRAKPESKSPEVWLTTTTLSTQQSSDRQLLTDYALAISLSAVPTGN